MKHRAEAYGQNTNIKTYWKSIKNNENMRLMIDDRKKSKTKQ